MTVQVEDYSPHDERIWNEELEEFVPDRIFDAHIHMIAHRHLPEPVRSTTTWGEAGFETLVAWSRRLYPNRETHFLVLGSPVPGIDVDGHNSWAIEQLAADPASRMNRLVTPDCRPEDIERDIVEHGFIGLKPYRLFSVTGDIAECRIHEFLPHEQLELADQLGLWVTMHLSRSEGCADEANLEDLAEYTANRYPRIKWILAHCARSFTYWPIREAIERLRDMPNIFYDTSAVTDIRPVITLLSKEDHRRIFYGSDGVDSTFFHGQYVALGRAWQGLDVERAGLQFPHCHWRPILAIYEQLLSMKQAVELIGMTREQVEDIFWRNAVREFGIEFDTTA